MPSSQRWRAITAWGATFVSLLASLMVVSVDLADAGKGGNRAKVIMRPSSEPYGYKFVLRVKPRKMGLGDIGVRKLRWKKWGTKSPVARGRYVTFATSEQGEPIKVKLSKMGRCEAWGAGRVYRKQVMILNSGTSKKSVFREDFSRHCLIKRECNGVTFKPDPEGSGAFEVRTRGVKCGKARKMLLKCGRSGKRPPGWKASMTFEGLVLKKGHRRILGKIAGASPPRAASCITG